MTVAVARATVAPVSGARPMEFRERSSDALPMMVEQGGFPSNSRDRPPHEERSSPFKHRKPGRPRQPSCERTSAATFAPSARPLVRGWTSFMTLPMSLRLSAPASAIASRTISAISCSDS